jgi:hypothetical protein
VNKTQKEEFKNKVGNLTIRDIASLLKDPAVSEEEKEATKEVVIDIAKMVKTKLEDKGDKS